MIHLFTRNPHLLNKNQKNRKFSYTTSDQIIPNTSLIFCSSDSELTIIIS
jgi:hypothetical protein